MAMNKEGRSTRARSEEAKSPPLPLAGEGLGVRGSNPQLLLDECEQVVAAHGDLRRNAKDAPAPRLNLLLPKRVARSHFTERVDAAVDLDGDPGLDDCEIDDVASDGMLSADDDAMLTQRSKRVPSFLLGEVCVAPKALRGADVLVFPQIPSPPAPLPLAGEGRPRGDSSYHYVS